MKFDPQAIVCLSIAAFSAWNHAEAFAPSPRFLTKASSGVITTSGSSVVSSYSEQRRTRSSRLFMADEDEDDEDDDDDDEDDYDYDPLGEGVDSIAWLPSVIGSKGKDVTSAREVSQK
jgi:hypothetical protein